MRVIAMTNADARFYPLLGPYLSRRDIVAELGSPVWDDEGKTWFVAVDGAGQVLGFAAVARCGERAVLCSHYVLPGARRAGVFSELLRHSVAHARSCSSTVEAMATRAAAPVYLRAGFRSVRETRNFVKVVLE